MAPLEMYLDGPTVILFALIVKLLLAGLFLGFWLKNRRMTWFGWWSASFLFGSGASITILLRGLGGEFLSVGLAGAALIAAYLCCWNGARVFERREPVWLPLIAMPALWLAACLVPAFVQHAPSRVVLSSILLSTPLALTSHEFWRGRAELLPSRWMIVALFASLALIFAVRIPLLGVAPFPFGALPAEPAWVGAFNAALFFHTVLLAVVLVAITKERLELEQRMAADTDPLTGVWNRRACMSRGERLVSRHERDGQDFSLLFLDIDDFKRLNDRLGHSGGDEVLRRFVDVVQNTIRPSDFVFRIGGEEFCCLLPQTNALQSRHVAERIRRNVEAVSIQAGSSAPVKITVSVGIASTEAAGYDLETLLRAADGAVYAAKRQGRNRVVTATADDVGFVRSVA
ncbi:MAG TPA: GGDEF domain-containing protein [Xanthobacteraceae bacterium]|nr:GGDEF domain-containing protein [Xanthobacteraceae bacterium]